MIDRAEAILHDQFGDVFYWEARRSMRYASHLVNAANEYRRSILASDDDRDRTVIHDDWTKTKVVCLSLDSFLSLYIFIFRRITAMQLAVTIWRCIGDDVILYERMVDTYRISIRR